MNTRTTYPITDCYVALEQEVDPIGAGRLLKERYCS